jgi:hypothetical protein|tara:strand:- start:2604 stop:2837 length:234 start_codon:yes stop_codon:yes gene_type:complete
MTDKQDLDHVYIDPEDGKEHVNHGMLEYTEEDLKMHGFMDKHEGEQDDGWKQRHSDKVLEKYCDNHPDALECRVYDD